MILLVVDTQKGCFNENLFSFETVKNNIKHLIAVARENNVEVAYVQHDDGPGTDLDKNADSYEIYEEFAPRENEKRFEKNVNSAFHPMTGLTEYLNSKGEKDLVVIGVSTDFCMDATIKSGFEKGFNIYVPAYTNSTYDNPYFDKETAYRYYNEFMWGERYAKIITVDEAVSLLQSQKSSAGEENSLKIYLEDGEIKVKGTINLGHIGSFKDSQIEISESLEEIRDWDIIEEYYNPECSDDELISYLNVYFKTFTQNIEKNIENINGTFLLQVFTDMDSCENDFMVIDGLFDEEKLLYGNEEDIAEIYNPVRQGLNSLSPYLETPNDGSIPKGHIEGVLRSFYPMFNFDFFLKNIVPEYIELGDGEISFQCSDNFDNAILCGAYAVLGEELAFSDWHNF